ncbi:hypothetical protein AcV5_004799 [Taiwanofungus camphoratus]|nr:hypothetical protein AcV5_004799 [Antrodia cinnamomea]
MVHDDVLTGLRNAGNGDNGTAAEGTHQNEVEQRRKTMGKAQARWKREENRRLPFRGIDIELKQLTAEPGTFESRMDRRSVQWIVDKEVAAERPR